MRYYIVTKEFAGIHPGSVIGLKTTGEKLYKDRIKETKFQIGDVVLASRQYGPKKLTKIIKIGPDYYLGKDSTTIRIQGTHEDSSVLIQR